MSERSPFFAVDLVIFLGGLVLILAANTETITSSTSVARALETMGLSMAGYAPIHLIVTAPRRIEEWRTRQRLDESFRPAVRVVESRETLPIFIAADVEGCLTPPRRSAVDLRKLQRVRAYCEFVKADTSGRYPPLAIFTGRSQGYVELLAQTLDMMDPNLDLPFVIENGSALYYPNRKKTEPLVSPEQRQLIADAFRLLSEELTENDFEPKTFMVTVNPRPRSETIEQLRDCVSKVLDDAKLRERLEINSSASAVDITPKDVAKVAGLARTLEEYRKLRPGRPEATLKDVAALVDSTSDLGVIDAVGRAYCPNEDVHPEVVARIRANFGSKHIVAGRHIDFVIEVIQRETGVRLV